MYDAGMYKAARHYRHEPVNYDDYLRMEAASRDARHELVGGTVHTLASESRRHNLIALRLASQLLAAAGGGPCQTYAADVKLRVSDDTVYYPDLMVVCDPADADPLVVTTPCLIIEVLSPSTASIDRREKLIAYRRIPSLLAYLIVDQDEPRIERHWRDALDAPWQMEVIDSGIVPAPCLEAELVLDALYESLPPAS